MFRIVYWIRMWLPAFSSVVLPLLRKDALLSGAHSLLVWISTILVWRIAVERKRNLWRVGINQK